MTKFILSLFVTDNFALKGTHEGIILGIQVNMNFEGQNVLSPF